MTLLLNGLFSLVLEGYILSNGSSGISVWSTVGCADQCLANPLCVGFFYKKSGLCQLSQSRDVTSIIYEGTPAIGMRFYVLHKGSCPMEKGYSLSIHPPVCYRVGYEKMNHRHAMAACQNDGGFLIRIYSQLKQDFAATLRKEMKSDFELWIDGSDNNPQKEWRFSNGTLMTYSRWSTRVRLGSDNDEHCVRLHKAESMWSQTDCDLTYRYICEISTA